MVFMGFTYLMDRQFNKRNFYTVAIKKFASKSKSFKIASGLLGGILFAFAWVSIILSFLIFKKISQ
jgi:hypothetical protein